MPVINRVPPSAGTCDACHRGPVRVDGYAMSENTGMGWQGLGQVRLCANCQRERADALDAMEPMVEELKAALTAKGIPIPPKATRPELVALLDGKPPPAAPPAPAGAKPEPTQFSAGKPARATSTLNQLIRMSRQALLDRLAEMNIVGVPAEATKEQMAARILTEEQRA